jgi:hypothetical protein
MKSEPRFVIFAKFSFIPMCQNIQKASQFPKTPCPSFLAHSGMEEEEPVLSHLVPEKKERKSTG